MSRETGVTKPTVSPVESEGQARARRLTNVCVVCARLARFLGLRIPMISNRDPRLCDHCGDEMPRGKAVVMNVVV